MSIAVMCPTCEKTLNAPDNMSGRMTICRNCGAALAVPSDDISSDDISETVNEFVIVTTENTTTKPTLLTKYKQDFSDYLKKLEEEPRKLVESGKDFKALMESFEIITKITEIHEQLTAYFKVIFNHNNILTHFGSEKISQIGHEIVPTRECFDDNSIEDEDKERYVLGELRKLGYKKRHWYFSEVFLLEICYMIDVLTIVIEPEYIPLEEREDEDDSERQDRYVSAEVKMKVWRRDNGKCSSCGSKEKLEYDHIIPVSKGGSNTERNVQLLCEKCNREKAAKIA